MFIHSFICWSRFLPHLTCTHIHLMWVRASDADPSNALVCQMDGGVSFKLLKAQCQEAQIREGPLLIWVRRSPRLQVYHYVRILWGPLGSSNTSLLRLLSGFASDDLLNSLEISTNTETAMLSRSSLFDRAKYYVSTLHWQTPNECPKGCTWSMYDCQLCHHLLHWSYIPHSLWTH